MQSGVAAAPRSDLRAQSYEDVNARSSDIDQATPWPLVSGAAVLRLASIESGAVALNGSAFDALGLGWTSRARRRKFKPLPQALASTDADHANMLSGER